jgi:hypothetical protein
VIPMKPDLPTNCREHANGRVREIERRYYNGDVSSESAKFLCGCSAVVTRYPGNPPVWTLDETIFWKEGQA